MGKAKKPVTGLDAGEAIILKYLQAQNRPYSASKILHPKYYLILHCAADIFNNLHGQVGKTAVVKGLNTLFERGEIHGKAYGKQWVYVARQDTLPTPSPEELNELDDRIEQLKNELTAQKDATKQAQSRMLNIIYTLLIAA